MKLQIGIPIKIQFKFISVFNSKNKNTLPELQQEKKKFLFAIKETVNNLNDYAKI